MFSIGLTKNLIVAPVTDPQLTWKTNYSQQTLKETLKH